MSKYFEIEYYYYQHNSGIADNGHYTQRIKFKNTPKDVVNLLNKLVKINQAIDFHNHCIKSSTVEDIPFDVENITDDLIPYSGYFTEKPKLFEVTSTQKEINYEGNYVAEIFGENLPDDWSI